LRAAALSSRSSDGEPCAGGQVLLGIDLGGAARGWSASSGSGILRGMSPTAEEVLKQALTLDESDRASVAGALIESLHEQVDPDAEEAWDAVIRRRVEELESGAVETIPWTEVRKRLFRGFE
jgi:putative addiction module component (TIGR02574 family)